MSNNKSEYFTVTMTNHLPVKIKRDEWILLAEVKDLVHPVSSDCWEIKVRYTDKPLAKKRCIVHGAYIPGNEDELEIRHGFLVEDVAQAPEAINDVARLIGADSMLAHRCISKLPALVI